KGVRHQFAVNPHRSAPSAPKTARNPRAALPRRGFRSETFYHSNCFTSKRYEFFSEFPENSVSSWGLSLRAQSFTAITGLQRMEPIHEFQDPDSSPNAKFDLGTASRTRRICE